MQALQAQALARYHQPFEALAAVLAPERHAGGKWRPTTDTSLPSDVIDRLDLRTGCNKTEHAKAYFADISAIYTRAAYAGYMAYLTLCTAANGRSLMPSASANEYQLNLCAKVDMAPT
jgi:hypothetical protein